jgi:hypothetical protein
LTAPFSGFRIDCPFQWLQDSCLVTWLCISCTRMLAFQTMSSMIAAPQCVHVVGPAHQWSQVLLLCTTSGFRFCCPTSNNTSAPLDACVASGPLIPLVSGSSAPHKPWFKTLAQWNMDCCPIGLRIVCPHRVASDCLLPQSGLMVKLPHSFEGRSHHCPTRTKSLPGVRPCGLRICLANRSSAPRVL